MTALKAFAIAATVALASIGSAAHAQFVANSPDFMTPEVLGAKGSTGSPLTRGQVIAGRDQARRDGTLVVGYLTSDPLYTAGAKAAPSVAGKTRMQVRAELEQARRDGTLVVDYVTGQPLYGAMKRNAASGAE